MKKEESKKRMNEGFTLVELMLVIVILGVLAGVVLVGTRGLGDSARRNATRASIDSICTAINLYEIETGQFPNAIADLTVATDTRGPLIDSQNIQDGWGQDFQYNKNAGKFKYEIRSAGTDSQMGTEDDITN